MNRNTLLLLVLSCLITSCLSPKTKREVVLPAGVMAWAGVSEDVEYGVAHAEAAGTLTAGNSAILRQKITYLGSALAAKDMEALLSSEWNLIAPWAERGIQAKVDDGVISVGVAGSLRERVLRFTYLMGMLGKRMVSLAPSSKRQYWIDVPGVPTPVFAGSDPKVALSAR